MKKITDFPEPEKKVQWVESLQDLGSLFAEDLKDTRYYLDSIRQQCRIQKLPDLKKRASRQYVRLGNELRKRKTS